MFDIDLKTWKGKLPSWIPYNDWAEKATVDVKIAIGTVKNKDSVV